MNRLETITMYIFIPNHLMIYTSTFNFQPSKGKKSFTEDKNVKFIEKTQRTASLEKTSDLPILLWTVAYAGGLPLETLANKGPI